ncbi:ATP-binding protein [Bdellovibrio sp. SKB1291214]|uniref:PAS domain-containing hybrid sensor histidine kinase/response regulator n=1 Tax=Bdellovibrio sp. SKB1291214 TaxID=1732569 RepID=UPI000B51B524|nr:ATP-binding protein [Bdellovibrio sp. SKB1291214]UYL08600.1 ATP-binding protein [Bdellovibrio sp. SKB1291214]
MNKSAYEALVNSHALIEFDPEGRILWANRNFLNLVGYEMDEIHGKPHSIFLPSYDLHANEYAELWDTLRAGNPQVGEFKRLSKSGTEIWVHCSYTPVKNDSGDVIKILSMAFDITEKRQLAENLERKNQELLSTAAKARAATYAKSVFLANMSHEIRTPLNSIIGITDTLAETPLDGQQTSFVEILQRANYQLMTIINDVLDLSKVEAGEIVLHMLPFSLQRMIDDIVSILDFRAKEKGLQLKVTVAPDIQDYYIGDSDRLRQVLINLLNNAIKFTHQGTVSLHVQNNNTTRTGNLLFSVSDTGIGVSKQKFKDIFRPFTQADPTTTRRYGGTGLGLSISQKIVSLMGGLIWLESEPNVGSTFYFTASMPATTERKTSMHNPLQGRYQLNDINHFIQEQRLKVLVVDDVDDNRNLLGIYLQKTIHQITYAESGSDAVGLAKTNHYDVIFMDVQMPGMDGHEATMRIREIEAEQGRRKARIFACTANAFAEDIERSMKAGCDMHLSKPIRKDTLIKAINSCFAVNEVAVS